MSELTEEYLPKSMSKPKIVILEGCDRTGKTSLKLSIDKLAKYKHITLDRGPIGFKAYCEIFDKGFDDYDHYVRMEDELSKNGDVLVIYLYAPEDVLSQRVIDTDHEYIDYKKHLPIYKKHFVRSPITNKVSFDTSRISSDGIVKTLIRQGLL